MIKTQGKVRIKNSLIKVKVEPTCLRSKLHENGVLSHNINMMKILYSLKTIVYHGRLGLYLNEQFNTSPL